MKSIRKAVPTDAKKAVPLIIDAIGDIAERMTGENEPLEIEKDYVIYLDVMIIHILIYIRILRKSTDNVAGQWSCIPERLHFNSIKI